MISHLELQSFQPHEHLSIILESGVNCICGSSDTGKSSLLRAVEWIALNETPKGELATHGSDTTTGTLTVDGHIIERSKGKDNTYILDNASPLRAFGTGVPNSIANILNVGPANFSSQHSPLFWLSDTPGQVSRNLNAIVNLDIIDSTLANVSSVVRQSRTELDLTDTRLREAKTRQDELAWVDGMDRDLKIVEQAFTKLEKTRLQSLRLADLLQKAQDYTESRDRALAITQGARLAIESGDRLANTSRRMGLLSVLLIKVDETVKSTSIKVPDFVVLEQAKNRVLEVMEKWQALDNLLGHLDYQQREKNRLSEVAGLADQELKKLTLGQLCPVCSQPMPQQSS